jgi:octaprenyl-diphosphate synthase
MNLGVAFQLVDDALDCGKAAKLGKNVGDDFREGKITAGGAGVPSRLRRRTRILAAHLEQGEMTEADLDHAIGR